MPADVWSGGGVSEWAHDRPHVWDRAEFGTGEADVAEFVTQYQARYPEPMEGRPMKEYVVVPSSVRADPELMAAWSRAERGVYGGVGGEGEE